MGVKTYRKSIGTSREGREIIVHANFEGAAPNSTLLIGGTHGDEGATVRLLESFCTEVLLYGLTGPVAVLPLANPDGYVKRSRYNACGVDLNRNFPTNWHAESAEPSGTAAWSEPETRALRDFVFDVEPARIVSLHWALAEIDADGHQSTGLAHHMWNALSESERKPYRMRVYELGHGMRRLDETYEFCPGSLGQWCGCGLQYRDGSRPAMITLELPYDPAATSRPSPLPAGHLADLHVRWESDPEAYLSAVGPGVHKMLRAACDYLNSEPPR